MLIEIHLRMTSRVKFEEKFQAAFISPEPGVSGCRALRLCLGRFRFHDRRRIRKVFPPLGLRKPFPIIFWVQKCLLATEQRY